MDGRIRLWQELDETFNSIERIRRLTSTRSNCLEALSIPLNGFLSALPRTPLASRQRTLSIPLNGFQAC